MTLESEPILEMASAYLRRQSWYKASATEPSRAFDLVSFDVLEAQRPGLARVLLSQGEQAYQLLVGWRSSNEIAGLFVNNESALLGATADDEESVVVYDALFDDQLALRLLRVVTHGAEHAERVRTVSSLVSHASLVYDERLFMKCYRVLETGTRPEVEISFALDDLGFNAILAPVARWSASGRDLAYVREFQPTALEGRLLALTSLRDLLAYAATSEEPTERFDKRTLRGIGDLSEAAASAGGDLSSEMIRLGVTTARMHIALAQAFGDEPIDARLLAGALPSALGGAHGLSSRVAACASGSLGKAIRIHGDFHLRRVMRSEAGWIVAGFSDDPLYRTDARSGTPLVASPFEDVADMCFALDEVAKEAVSMRPPSETELASALGAAWTKRNREAFVKSYVNEIRSENLIPQQERECALLLGVFDAVRDRSYEAAAVSP